MVTSIDLGWSIIGSRIPNGRPAPCRQPTDRVVAPGNMATVDVEMMGQRAEVAELADAGDSKSPARKGLGVRLPSSA